MGTQVFIFIDLQPLDLLSAGAVDLLLGTVIGLVQHQLTIGDAALVALITDCQTLGAGIDVFYQLTVVERSVF